MTPGHSQGAFDRLLLWARNHACHYSKCYHRPMVALSAMGGMETYCEQHAAEVRAGGGELFVLPNATGEAH